LSFPAAGGNKNEKFCRDEFVAWQGLIRLIFRSYYKYVPKRKESQTFGDAEVF